jgi:hypothetical protein
MRFFLGAVVATVDIVAQVARAMRVRWVIWGKATGRRPDAILDNHAGQ